MVIDLLEKTPELSDDIGRNARELLSLKILERLFIQGAHANPRSSALSQAMRLDPSDRCEDVLRQIWSEISSLHPKPARPDILKWDLEPFIKHKRSSLPKYALKQLKDAILTGSHSISASLKEQSGLPVGNQAERDASVKDGNCSGITPRVEGSEKNDSYLLPRDLPDEKLVPADRKRRASGESYLGPLYTYSQDSFATPNCRDQNLLGGTPKRYTGEERCSLEERTQVEVMGQSVPCGDGNNKCTSSKGLVGNDEVLQHEKQAPHFGAEVPNEKLDEAMLHGNAENAENGRKSFHGLIKTTEGMDKFGQNVQRIFPNVGRAEEGVNISSGNDGYHESTNNVTKKKKCLSSQCTYDQDSLAKTDSRELYRCMKCNKGGKLLYCNSCPLVIHASCLGSDVSFDTREKFYCPFCKYSQAISKYMEVKKKSSLARKNLAAFICLGPQQDSKKYFQRSLWIGGSHLEEDDGLPKSNEVNQRDVVENVNNQQCRKKLEYEQAGPSELHSGYSPPFGGKAVGSTDRLAQGLNKDKRDEKLHPARFIHNSQDETTSCQVLETSGSEKHAAVRAKKAVLCPTKKDLPCEDKCSRRSQSPDAEEISGEENENSGASRFQKRERQKLYPAIPQLRRKKLPWTSEEEETLKAKRILRAQQEGMRLCGSPDDKIIPWTKILEFGYGVYPPSRGTMDLKDKWRNICKASTKSK